MILTNSPTFFALLISELANLILVASTEMNTDEDRAAYADVLREVLR